MDKIRSKGPRGNFFITSNNVFELDLHPIDKLVYICLMRYSNNDTRQAFPGYNKIAEDCGISERRAKTAIKNLEEKGLIIKERRQNKYGWDISNLYTVIEPEQAFGMNEVHPRSEHGAPPGVNNMHPRGERGAPKKDLFKKTYIEKEGPQLNNGKDEKLTPLQISELKKFIKSPGN